MKADPQKRLIGSSFDEQAFGNFWISYEDSGKPMRSVNDRDQIFLDDLSSGKPSGCMVLRDLRGAGEKTVIDLIS